MSENVLYVGVIVLSAGPGQIDNYYPVDIVVCVAQWNTPRGIPPTDNVIPSTEGGQMTI